MRQADQLSEFVRTALSDGRSRADISAAMTQAGWSVGEATSAMDGWAESSFSTPVPRPRPYVSAREVFLYGLMFVALSMTTIYLAQLGMALIDLWMQADPVIDTNNYYYNGNYLMSQIRWAIAVLVVFLPVFVFLNIRTERTARADPAKRRSLVRKWFVSIALFVSLVVILGNLIYTIYALLNGELTPQFLAKAGLVAVIALIVIFNFRDEMKDRAVATV